MPEPVPGAADPDPDAGGTAVTIGILHPGEMGASIGAAARANGARVLWLSEGRSERTRARAEAAGLEDVAWLNALVNQSAIVISICPPEAALAVAEQVADVGFRGLYVDANAIAPATARRVGAIVERAGADFVDGCVIGPPARRRGETRLYLAGAAARKVARHFGRGALEARVLDGPPGRASALKMAYAAYTKGSTALLAAILALAEAEEVRAPLEAEWDLGAGDASGSAAQHAARVRGAAARAWRWTGEMEEIAATFEADGLPGGFHRAAAEIFRRLARYRDDPQPPDAVALAVEILRAREAAP